MPSAESYDVLIIGSGEAGKWMAWTMGADGHHTAVVERNLIGGSCPNIACLPSKNVIRSAKVCSFAVRAAEFGVDLQWAATNMAGVQARKRAMVVAERQAHLDRFRETGVELVMGEARFVGDRTVEVDLADGGTRQIRGEQTFLDLGTHGTIPDVPGLGAAGGSDRKHIPDRCSAPSGRGSHGQLGPNASIRPSLFPLPGDLDPPYGRELPFGIRAGTAPQDGHGGRAINRRPAPYCGSVVDRLGPDEEVLLRVADELHENQDLSEPTWSLLSRTFDELEVIEAIMLVGYYHLVCFVLNALGVPIEPDAEFSLGEPPVSPRYARG